MESSHQTKDLECFANRCSILWNLPTIFHPDLLQQYCRRTFFHSAYCSLSNTTCFRSVWCWRTMIPGKIFASFAKVQGIVSVNDFRLPIRLQELLQAPLCFLRSFCFARIRLDPLGGQVLHYDCISMIVSRFTTFTDNFVICCNQITKIFCMWYDSANTSSARGPCDFGPLWMEWCKFLWSNPFTEWIGASSFEVILARQSSHFPTWASTSRTSGYRRIFHTLLRRRSWRRIRLCRFCTLVHIVSETEIVSFRTLPASFSIANSLLDFFVHAVSS